MSGLLALLLSAAATAPVTAVTIYADRARVVRTATVTGDTQLVEFPLLHGKVDVSTIRVEGAGAQVLRVDLDSVPAQAFSEDAARKAADLVQELTDKIAVATASREALDAQLNTLRLAAPAIPKEELGKPMPRLDASGWGSATQFLAARLARLQADRQKLSTQLDNLQLKRAQATTDAQRLGGTLAGGVRVRAVVKSESGARVLLSYETVAARWRPSYELQYLPERGHVVLAFSGLVSQESEEDWENVRLTLSTARPARFARAPELQRWRIGEVDRFIPTPTPVALRPEPAPELGAQPPPPEAPAAANEVRSFSGQASAAPRDQADFISAPSEGRLVGTVVDAATRGPLGDVNVFASSPQLEGDAATVTDTAGFYSIPALPRGTYALRFEKEGYKPYVRQSILVDGVFALRLNVDLLPENVTLEGADVTVVGKAPVIDMGKVQTGLTVTSAFAAPAPARARSAAAGLGLGPPQAYQEARPVGTGLGAESGGLDLAFTSAHAETVKSGQGVLRVPLTTETWPVEVTRKAFPALSPQTYLVARLRSPAKAVLPGGPVALSVGTDPAGAAELPLMRPGEDLTLPLGVDRALLPIRNVQLVLAEQGVFSKDDASEYRVTLEMANPYRIPVTVTFVDQVPVASGDNIQVTLLETKPWAREDKRSGRLEWDLTLPPSGTGTASFRYRVVRPKGWKLQQQETAAPP